MADDSTICSVCRGTQTVSKRIKDDAKYTKIPCWRCNGTGVWIPREEAWPYNQQGRR